MGIILGFGSTEQQVEQHEEEAIKEFVSAVFLEMGCDYFTAKMVERVRKWCDERASSSRTEAEQYKDAVDYPDRYSSYWATVLDDASNIVVILKFHHINRRHAMSPDGWALLQSTRLVHVSTWDVRRAA